MLLKTVYEIADGLAPFALSKEWCERYGGYDNSGVLIDCGGEISKILFSLDLSAETVARAKETGANCVFTHHPAIYTPLKSLTPQGEGKNVAACVRAGISVISAHINLDCAQGGIDECLMNGLGGAAALAVMEPLSRGGYGRVFGIDKKPFEEFTSEIARRFRTRRTVVYGNRPTKRIASFCGAGTEEKSVAFALENGADTFVSSDGKHHLIAAAVESGMNVVMLTHYAAENYGFFRFFEKFKLKSGVPCEYFADERFL